MNFVPCVWGNGLRTRHLKREDIPASRNISAAARGRTRSFIKTERSVFITMASLISPGLLILKGGLRSMGYCCSCLGPQLGAVGHYSGSRGGGGGGGRSFYRGYFQGSVDAAESFGDCSI